MHALALLAAAASWSAPQTVSTPHNFVGPLMVSSDQRGGALAAWDWQDGVSTGQTIGAAQAQVSSAGTVSAEQPAPTGLVAAVAYGDGRSVPVASRELNQRGTRWRVTVRDGAQTRTLATGFVLFRPQLSVAPDGSAIVAWVELHGNRHVVRAVTRTGRGAFSKPATVISTGQTIQVTTAISKRGDALVGVVRDRRVLVRVKRPGAAWGQTTQLDSALNRRVRVTWQITAAFDGKDRAVFVWRRHRFTAPGRPGVLPLAAATLGPSAKRWSSAQSLETDGARSPSLAPARSGGLVLSYRIGPNSSASPRVRESGADGRFGAALDAAPPQGGVRSVTAVDDGAAGLVVGWVVPNPSGDGGGIGYASAEAPDASTFGPREQVTPNEATFDMSLARTAAGVRAFWTARPDGTGPSVPASQVRTLVRTALRSG